jgi:hypothetical protein
MRLIAFIGYRGLVLGLIRPRALLLFAALVLLVWYLTANRV